MNAVLTFDPSGRKGACLDKTIVKQVSLLTLSPIKACQASQTTWQRTAQNPYSYRRLHHWFWDLTQSSRSLWLAFYPEEFSKWDLLCWECLACVDSYNSRKVKSKLRSVTRNRHLGSFVELYQLLEWKSLHCWIVFDTLDLTYTVYRIDSSWLRPCSFGSLLVGP